MFWQNKVVWREGMFLRAQHFQQQDRFVEALVRAATASLTPFPWGVATLTIDRELLGTGRFALAAASGMLEDGTPFAIPDETAHPPPIEPGENVRNCLVYLAAPTRQAGAIEVAADGPEAKAARFAPSAYEAFDTHSASASAAEVQVGRLRLSYLLETQDRGGFVGLPVARILEVLPDRKIVLDERWIAPALVCSAVAPLMGFINELTGMLRQRAEAIAARLGQPGARGVAEITDFLLLQTINRVEPLLAHWSAAGAVHPETLYRALASLAGELATFTEATRRPPAYPAYRHEDLQRSFAPVIADLRKSLSAVVETTAVAIPLQERRFGVRVGPIVDRNILKASQFVLSVQADMPAEQLRRVFPNTVKIGAVEQIRELVNVALPGIAVRPLPVAPRQIPFYAGAVYFELDRGSPHWQQMQTSGGFAIHVSGDYPNLKLELWAIRG